MPPVNSRPQGIQEAGKTKGRKHHEDAKLDDHRSQRENHEIVLQCHKGEAGDYTSVVGYHQRADSTYRGNMKIAIRARRSIPVVRAIGP